MGSPTKGYAVAIAITVAFSSRLARAEPVSTPPASSAALDDGEQEYPPPSTRWWVIGTGLGTSALWYGAGTGMSYWFPDAPGARDLRVPLIGPWKAIAHNGCADADPDCSTGTLVLRTLLTALDGVGQVGGLLIAAEGIFLPTQYPGGSRPPKASPSETDEKNKLFFLPAPTTFGSRGVGVGLIGRF